MNPAELSPLPAEASTYFGGNAVYQDFPANQALYQSLYGARA
jgi:hypothetical protein